MIRRVGRLTSKPGRCRIALLLAGLFLLTIGPAGAVQIRINFSLPKRHSKTKSAPMAQQLAQEVAAVQGRFGQARAALPLVQGAGGQQAYARKAVTALLDGTERDLTQAIERLQKPDLAGLSAWATAEFQRLRGNLAALPDVRVASSLSSPRGMVLLASSRTHAPARPSRPPSRKTAPLKPPPAPPAPPPPPAVDAQRSGQILDQVGELIGRLLSLAEKNDLEVELWVGSTPSQDATFRFWPRASAQGAPPAPTIIRTNGKRAHVLRGLYSYSTGLGKGRVVEIIRSGGSTPDNPEIRASEDLDLVNGSPFFCCRFDESYCHHVDDEKQCRIEKR